MPVVYFLHDLWGNDAVLWKHGVAQRLLARMASGDLPPFLLVAPEGDRGFWADSWDGGRRYETWVAEQLPRQVEALYPLRPGRSGRAWVGISMGGMGAVRIGLSRARSTGAIASVSGVLLPLDEGFVRDARWPLRPVLRRVFGPGPDHAALRRADAYRALGRIGEVPEAERPPLFIAAGSEDKYRLDDAARLFAGLAREKGLEVELAIAPGGHDWRYWGRSAEESIAWAVRRLAAEAGEAKGP
jgi:S-formylglutathione hydrolase FrmB